MDAAVQNGAGVETEGRRWTDERIGRLKKLREQGWSASEIASDLGAGFTRNAILGELHRLKVPTPSRAPKKPKPPKPPKERKSRSVRVARLPRIEPEGSEEAVKPRGDALWQALPTSQPVRLVDHREGRQCAWPLEPRKGGEYHCCGAPTMEASSYCAAHHSIAYRRPET